MTWQSIRTITTTNAFTPDLRIYQTYDPTEVVQTLVIPSFNLDYFARYTCIPGLNYLEDGRAIAAATIYLSKREYGSYVTIIGR
jgi:hypothetical protein